MADKSLHVPVSSVAQRLVHGIPYSRPATPAHQSPIQVGWIGLGAMGYLMARNLANHRATHFKDQPPLLVWNRSKEKSEKLLHELGEHRVSIAQTVVDVAIKCDIIISSLSSDDVVRSVFKENVAALQAQPPTKHKIFVETSTIYPSVAGELDTLVSSIPYCSFVTAPILGPPALAENATLIIVLSGDYRSKKEVAYTLVPAIGRRVMDLGGNVEKAPTFKLIGNSMVLGSMELIAEAYTMAEKSGIGQELVYEYIKELIPAPIWLAYGDKMLHNNFDGTVGFAIDGGVKDATHIRRLVSEHNSPMPAVDIAHNHLLAARALHAAQARTGTTSFPVLDWSALIAGTRVAAGLDAFDGGKESGPVPEPE
ncbi:NAD-P-binding protein [Lactifluus subvellereus]|nr:NAD-P-binding protein [Lactifluus subvellereus]